MKTVSRTEDRSTGQWQSSTTFLKRVGPGPAGAFAQSGYWVPVVTAETKAAGNGIVLQLSIENDNLTMRDDAGGTYRARFGGPKVEVSGDPPGDAVAVRRLSKSSFEETNYLDGKVTAINTYRLTDPRTLEIISRNVRSGFVDTYLLRKQ